MEGKGIIMRLYGLELYKLVHGKAFLIWSVLSAFLLVFYFWAQTDCERTTVNGEKFYGADAVRIDRQITEEYRGELTDEKIGKIVKDYGLPSEAVYDCPGWYDENYLNGFVADYLTDGYLHDWDNYRTPSKVYAIADTELGELSKVMGKGIYFAYTNGWKAFLDILQIGMVFASALILFGVSGVFAQEGQTNMAPLIFTTVEGRKKDIWAKTAAAFTLTIIVYGTVVFLCLLLSFCVFGLDGAQCPACVALPRKVFFRAEISLSYVPVGTLALRILTWNLTAVFLLCAVTLCVSAHYRSNFGAVSMAAALWGMPLFLTMFSGGLGYFFTSCMPIFLVMTDSVYESISWGREPYMYALIIPLFFLCVGGGIAVYRKEEG